MADPPGIRTDIKRVIEGAITRGGSVIAVWIVGFDWATVR